MIMNNSNNVSRRDSDRSESSEVHYDYSPKDDSKNVTEAYCSSLLKDLKLDSVPQECHTFASFRTASASQKKEEANPFAGMPANQALNAKSARANGRLNQAQIMRRMSSRARPKDRSWF
ncbi:unnamed protein product [Cylindrotheca closterium]|uniref:Uncharacterized protein n=1 Tax=Cylindrotheca closterium TaxID=2856 RepID=A0AAD2FHM8_9STRA|nr:unnamed protein product [Cylindrotheca closterium]